MGLAGSLDGLLKRAAPAVSPFYRRHPYDGPLWLTEVDIRGAISPADRFFFNRVPKAANSTITANLVRLSAARSGRAVREGREKWYFRRPLFASPGLVRKLDGTFFRFAFVRDPHTRTLSAFLDKIVGRRPQSRAFYAWWGRSGAPGFGDFCRYLEAGGLHDDIHWAPQTDILLLPPEGFHRIGRFESLEADLDAVLVQIFGPGVAVAGRSGPRSDADSALAAHYDDGTLAIVGRLYAGDLQAFGYGAPSIV